MDRKSEVKDAELTDLGIIQAINAGKKLFSHLNPNPNPNLIQKKINYIFCSKLRRTYQTAAHIMNVINSNFCDHNNLDIIVLPCSHELATNNQSLLNLYEAAENTSLCDKSNRTTLDKCKNNIQYISKSHTNANPVNRIECVQPIYSSRRDDNMQMPDPKYYALQWDFYDTTFKGYKSEKLTCTNNNNMISYYYKIY